MLILKRESMIFHPPPTPLLVSLTPPPPLLDSPEYVNDVTYINTTNIPDYTKKLKQYYCTGVTPSTNVQ